MAYLPYCAISEKAKAVNLARICHTDWRGTSVTKSLLWDRVSAGATSTVRGENYACCESMCFLLNCRMPR